MNSIDDLSPISNISSISRISRTNSFSKSFTLDNQKLESKNISESTKVSKSLNSCEKSVCDYAIQKLISECLWDIVNTNNKTIDKNTFKKLQKLLITHDTKKYIYLPNNSKDQHEELTLLGIIDLPQIVFNYEESLSIRNCLEAKLRDKIHSFIAIYETYAGSSKEVLKNNESILLSRFQQKAELENVHWKDKIEEICLEYKRDLLHCYKMLQHWNELKIKIDKKNTKISENLLLKAELAELRAVITKLTCTIRMYKETPVTIDAFKILNSNLDTKISTLNEEISEKTQFKKAYDTLRGTEYDEILRKYSEICCVIKKKRNLLDKL